MGDLTYSTEDLRELALEALNVGDTETATNLRHNADDTEEETEKVQ